ncbi:aldehyde dehydrogenase family protein (plasmid) [Rhizobium leguminosarum]
MANDTQYGLAAFVWTCELKTALKVAHAIDAGWVQINGVGGKILGQSYGGVKQSGLGRECTLEGMLDAFTVRKNVTANLSYGSRSGTKLHCPRHYCSAMKIGIARVAKAFEIGPSRKTSDPHLP